MTLKLLINDEEYLLDLRLNQDIVTENHLLSYQENGKTVIYKPTKEVSKIHCLPNMKYTHKIINIFTNTTKLLVTVVEVLINDDILDCKGNNECNIRD